VRKEISFSVVMKNAFQLSALTYVMRYFSHLAF